MKKFLAALVLALLAVTGLTACTSNGIQGGSIIRIALLNDFNSINADNVTADGSLATNQQVAALLDPAFYYVDSDETLVPNESFGTVTVISKQPYQVRYELTGKAKWSDGQAVTANDLLLSWLAARNPLDSGFNSSRTGSGLKWANSVPQVSSDLKSLTVTFDHPVADYRTALTVNAAAHLVAGRAFNLSDNAAALTRFSASVSTANLDDQKLLAEQYAQIYLARNLETLAPKVGAGPYLLTAFNLGQSLTLKANPEFTWGPLPKIETVEIKFLSDATAMMAAMQADLVDVAAPQESGIATVADLLGLAKSTGATLEVGGSHDIEAILLNYGEGSVFATSTSDSAKAIALRTAFLKMVPLGKILKALSTDSPVIGAKSWIYSSTSSYYAPFVESNGSADYELQNAELAQELLSRSNVSKPIDVRVLYDSNNPRSKTEFSLLTQYAGTVGFNLIDVSSRTPREVYTTGEFDVFITTEALAGEVGGDPYWFTGSSVTKFTDPNLDSLLADLSGKAETLDQVATLKKIDAELYKAQFGLPLYQVPSMLAYGKHVKKIIASPLGSAATYGYWNWSISR
ncbi:MAG: ABC transporter substrate-binding protein [Micrococcales bacterium]